MGLEAQREVHDQGQFPWTGEGDPLGQSLWKMTCGQVKFGDFQVKGLRKLAADENKIERNSLLLGTNWPKR